MPLPGDTRHAQEYNEGNTFIGDGELEELDDHEEDEEEDNEWPWDDEEGSSIPKKTAVKWKLTRSMKRTTRRDAMMAHRAATLLGPKDS